MTEKTQNKDGESPVTENLQNLQDLQYFVLGEEDKDEVYQFLLDFFFQREPMNVATGGNQYHDRSYIKKDYVPTGVSVGAREPSTNALVGVMLSYIKTRGEKKAYHVDTNVDHAGMRRFRMVMTHLHESFDVFGNRDVEKMVHLAILATRPGFEGKGIGSTLLKKSEDLGKSFGCQAADCEAMNPVTQRILRKSGYEVVYSLNCKGFRISGEEMFTENSFPEDTRLEVFVKCL